MTDLTLKEVREYCMASKLDFSMARSGEMMIHADVIGAKHSLETLAETIRAKFPAVTQPNQDVVYMQADGYASLADVLHRAFKQAAFGKGHERHAQGEPFECQVMQDGARRFGVGGLLFQAFKKSEESQRLPRDRAVNELLGAINYLAGAVIAVERNG